MEMSEVAGSLRPGSRWLTPDDPFVGRERECRLLEGMAGSVTGGGAAGVILGDAGIGKTALLGQIARTSTARIAWVRGTESEAVLPFAAAADLLKPFREHFRGLPPAQRHALEIALAISEGAVAGPLAVCAGALGVLAAAGEQRPLLVLVDDLQWVDSASQQLLIFVARRLADEHVVLLFAVRDQPGVPLPTHDLPVLRLSGLSLSECVELAARRRFVVAPEVLASIVAATNGNPLAVLETLARGVSSRSRPGGEQAIAVGQSVEHAWRGVLERLPDRTRRALFAIAITRLARAPGLHVVLDALDLSIADLGPAEEQDLVHVDSDAVDLRHPLLRCVLIDSTPLDVRLSTYRALAEVVHDDLRPWFLSQSVIGPDDEMALELEAAAVSARRRSGYDAAGLLAERSAQLTLDPEARARRLLEAATDGLLGGDPSAAGRAEEALSLRSDAEFLADATLVRGRALAWMGYPAQAYEELTKAAVELMGPWPQRAAGLLAEATLPAAMAGRPDQAIEAALQAEEGFADAPTFRVLAMAGKAYVLCGRVQEGRTRLDAARARIASADPVYDQQAMAILGRGRLWSEEYEEARSTLSTTIDNARQCAAPAILAFALNTRCEVHTWRGQWAAAYADATESLQWAEELHQPAMIGYSLMLLARIDAGRGERDRWEAQIDRARHEAGAFGVDCLRVYEAGVLGFAALTDGDPPIAVEHLERAWGSTTASGMGNPNVVPFAADLVEAHLRCGNPDRASELLAGLDGMAQATGLVFPAAAALRCHGLMADDVDEAADLFASARAVHARQPMPFEQARTLLCEGEVLRRVRRPMAARSPLSEAQAIFERLGAGPWAARAGTELGATGYRATRERDDPFALDILTPQELQIARMIAGGRNNAEAAAALFISRKTVEAHLTRVYRKLAIRSRSELTRTLVARGVVD
jgi:DNA-binding CsgD family transcriptional regulator/tetratricopeptide (TPR) repeat protein